MEEKGQIFLKIRCIRALPEPGGTPGSVTAPVRSLETEWQHRGGETGVGGGAGASAAISHVVTSNRPAPTASFLSTSPPNILVFAQICSYTWNKPTFFCPL